MFPSVTSNLQNSTFAKYPSPKTFFGRLIAKARVFITHQQPRCLVLHRSLRVFTRTNIRNQSSKMRISPLGRTIGRDRLRVDILSESSNPLSNPQSTSRPPFSQPQTRKGKLTVEHHLISAPSQTSDSSYTSSRAQDSTLAMSRFLSRKSDLGDRLLMQAEAQDRPTGQQYDKNRMGLSSHGFEFPKNNNREGRVQPSEVQRSNNMDALLSQIGAWQRDSGVDIREELHGRRDVRR